MHNVFKEYGLNVEVVIPPKKDKREKGYRFMRFNKLVDERILVAKLHNIFINSNIFANVSRFHREKSNNQPTLKY